MSQCAAGCGRPGAFTCSRCKAVKYCSSGCQHSNWAAHKVACTAVATAPAPRPGVFVCPRCTGGCSHGGSAAAPADSLVAACESGDVRRVVALCDNGGAGAPALANALIAAAQAGHTDVVLALLARGADVNSAANKMSALYWAAQGGHTATAQALLDAGARVGTRTRERLTPLHTAAELAPPALVAALLRHGARVDVVDTKNWTPLHFAVTSSESGGDRAEIVRALVDAGAPVDAITEGHNTPLMLAAQNGHAAAALVLCQAGSDVHHSKYTEYGLMNCIDIAVFNRRRVVAKILREFA